MNRRNKQANKMIAITIAAALGLTGGTAFLISGAALAAPPAGNKPMKPAPPRDKEQGRHEAAGDGVDCDQPQAKPEDRAKPRPEGAPPAPPTPPAPQADPAAGNPPVMQNGVSVVISGGHATDPVDHGRPVVLIAAALGVPTEVFREAFSGVTPAGLERGPTGEEAQSNKAALMRVLAPYGITNDRLDEVSNYYRYNGSQGGIWKHTDATAIATIEGGVVTGISITSAGSGYSSAPTVTVTGPNGTFTAIAEVQYGTELATNGSITSINLP